MVKNPKLRKIRNNFRNLILEAHKSIVHKLLDKRGKLSKYIFENPEKDTEAIHKQIGNLSREIQKNQRILNDSIILCPSCLKWDKDMTYNPVRKTWYCIECYEVLKKGNAERGTPE